MPQTNNNSSIPTVSIWDRSSLLVISSLLVVGTLKTISLLFWEEPNPPPTLESDDSASTLYNVTIGGDEE